MALPISYFSPTLALPQSSSLYCLDPFHVSPTARPGSLFIVCTISIP